jgi:hypothetical protein
MNRQHDSREPVMATPEYRRVVRTARAIARQNGTVMAVGWQYDDFADTGQVIGYCPLAAAGPAFVHTVLTVVQP